MHRDRRKSAGRRTDDNVVYLKEVVTPGGAEVLQLSEYLAQEARAGNINGLSVVIFGKRLSEYDLSHAGIALHHPELALGAIERLKIELQLHAQWYK